MKLHTTIRILCSFILPIFIAYPSYEEKSPLFFGSYTDNFVIRWGFQSICQHCYDPRPTNFATSSSGITTFDPLDVKAGDIIFVRNIVSFMKNLHPLIKQPYIIITAGDFLERVRKKSLAMLNNKKIIAWFGVHASATSHSKFYPIPLGIFQKPEHYAKRAEFAQIFAKLRQSPKSELLYSNFNVRKNKPDRLTAQAIFGKASFCTQRKRKPFLNFMKEMAQFKFALSPGGRGPDTYRTWEALLVGTIPIVKTSQLDELYEGLPVLIIKDWKEVTPQFLEQKYAEITAKKFTIEKLFLEYWLKKIERVKEAFLNA